MLKIHLNVILMFIIVMLLQVGVALEGGATFVGTPQC